MLLLAIFVWPMIELLAQDQIYSEKLGYPANVSLLIIYVDDAGLSWGSNRGSIHSIEEGVANSFSVMMPTSWVPGIDSYIRENPEADAGYHLTITSEWDDYRWGPVMGKPAVSGLVDEHGYLWGSVSDVVANASPEEIEKEIRAQGEFAIGMGFQLTLLDSQMGTLFADPDYLQVYNNSGIDFEIPVMIPGGHNSFLTYDYRIQAIKELKHQWDWEEKMEISVSENGRQVWEKEVPVPCDLHNVSYGWQFSDMMKASDKEFQQFYTLKYTETIEKLESGLSMVIMHCTNPSEKFEDISTTG